MSGITLCTYTYNDAGLARDLIASVSAWTRRPQRLLVVDDGSNPPFAMPPDTGGMAAALLRLPMNQGPGRAKAAGLSEAGTDLILSLDCDMRLAPDWLAEGVPLALRPDTGIVGASFVTDGGSGVVGRYLKNFDTVRKPLGETNFLTGGIWLFRRDVWRAVGGFGGYTRPTHEDHHFCGRVKDLGLRLLVAGPEARQVRRLSRIALVERFRAWLGPKMANECQSPEILTASALHLTQDMLQRMECALSLKEPLFAYMEVLLLAVFGASCCEGLKKTHPEEAAASVGALLHGLTEIFRPFPRLAALLRRDLASLKLTVPETAEHRPAWQSALDVLRALSRGGTFASIEKFLPLLQEEDGGRADFSFYADGKVGI